MVDRIRYPLLILALTWLIGLLLGLLLFRFELLLSISLAIGILFFILSLNHFNLKSKKWFIFLCFSVLLIAVFRMGVYQDNHQTFFTNEALTYIGEDAIGVRGNITSIPEVKGNLVKFTIQPKSYLIKDQEYVTNSKEELLVYLYSYDEEALEQISHITQSTGIKLTGYIEEPPIAKNPGQFDYKNYLEKQSIYWKFNVYDVDSVDVSNSTRFSSNLNKFRNYLLNKIDTLYEEPYAGFIKSILLGERQDLSGELKDDFSILGLSHILAISGLHLSVLTMMIFFILIRLKITREKATYILTIILVLYMFITGASPSVVRATTMTLILLYSISLHKKVLGLQALAFAFIIMTMYNPLWIYDVGFQLSFVVTFFIIWGLPIVNARIHIKNKVMKNSFSLVSITQVASFPLVFYYFNHYSILSIIANLIFVPFFSIVILPFSFIILVISLFSMYLASYLAVFLSKLLEIFFAIINIGADIFSLHYYGSFSLLIVIILYILILWILIRPRIKNSFVTLIIKKRIFTLEKIIFGTIIVSLLFSIIFVRKGEALITVIDVGQGDSILIETKDNYNILIDSGMDYVNNVLPYLHYNGIKKLDYAVITHEDMDHLGGYLSLIDNIKIDTFVVSKNFPRTEEGEELYDKILTKNINLIKIDKPKALRINDSTIFTFYPIDISSSDKENDHTIIASLDIYETNIFFASDLEEKGEEIFLNNYQLRDTDILKIGHHGSKTSTSNNWLETLQPENAIISVGENNRYNHPSDEVIERLEQRDIEVWRTDEDGAIIIYLYLDRYNIEKTIN